MHYKSTTFYYPTFPTSPPKSINLASTFSSAISTTAGRTFAGVAWLWKPHLDIVAILGSIVPARVCAIIVRTAAFGHIALYSMYGLVAGTVLETDALFEAVFTHISTHGLPSFLVGDINVKPEIMIQ